MTPGAWVAVVAIAAFVAGVVVGMLCDFGDD